MDKELKVKGDFVMVCSYCGKEYDEDNQSDMWEDMCADCGNVIPF